MIAAFDRQPHLKSELLSLRPLEQKDFDALFSIASDPMLWEQHPARDRYQRDVFEKLFADALASQGALLVQTPSGEAIGSSRYYDFKADQRSVVIGYTFIGRAFWGGTINHELKRLMLEHAFKSVDRVEFHIGEFNMRSQKGTQKIGAHFRERAIVDGNVRLVYEIDRASYARIFA